MPPLRTALARPRASARGADRHERRASSPSNLAPRAYPMLAKSIALGPPDQLLQSPSGRARRRTAPGCRGRARRRRGGRSLSAHHHLRRARSARRTRQHLRHERLARVGGDAGAPVERVRSRQRRARACAARAAVTQEALADYEQTMLLALEETETALVTYRQRQERLVKLTDEVRERTGRGIARPLSGRRRRFPRFSMPSGPSCRPRSAPRRRRPTCSRRSSAFIGRWGLK